MSPVGLSRQAIADRQLPVFAPPGRERGPMEPPNRREFVRADVRFPARYRLLTPQEIEKVQKGVTAGFFRSGFTTALMDELGEEIPLGSENEALYRCFQMINNKIDFVIDQLTLMDQGGGLPLREVTELSGSGLKFLTHESIPAGSYLKLDLLVPVTLQFRIETIVEVLRTEELPPEQTEPKKRYLVAAKIAAIEEEARDAIIRTVFRRQRKLIRMERSTKGD